MSPFRSLAVAVLFAVGCSPAAPVTSGPSTVTLAPLPTPPATTAPSATPTSTVGAIVGTWHRAQTCQEVLAAFTIAGLAESHAGWLAGFFVEGSPVPTGGNACEGARGPLEHSHFFTAAGAFGSHDENGQQVDDGDYGAVDADTLSFGSHATEFGFAGDLVADFAIQAGVLTFDVRLPQPCEGACRDAYAWALSAFASGPWNAGEVPLAGPRADGPTAKICPERSGGRASFTFGAPCG